MVAGKWSPYFGLPGTQLKMRVIITIKEVLNGFRRTASCMCRMDAYSYLFSSILCFLVNKFWVHWKFFMAAVLHTKSIL